MSRDGRTYLILGGVASLSIAAFTSSLSSSGRKAIASLARPSWRRWQSEARLFLRSSLLPLPRCLRSGALARFPAME